MIGVAQRRCAHDGVQMLDGGPSAIQPVEGVGERLGDVVPGCGAGIGGDDFDGVARSEDQKVDRGARVLGPDRVEPRQP